MNDHVGDYLHNGRYGERKVGIHAQIAAFKSESVEYQIVDNPLFEVLLINFNNRTDFLDYNRLTS